MRMQIMKEFKHNLASIRVQLSHFAGFEKYSFVFRWYANDV